MTIGPQSKRPEGQERDRKMLPDALDDIWDHIEWVEARAAAAIRGVWILFGLIFVLALVATAFNL